MTDRFDLEQQILQCWNVTSDIELVYDTMMNKEMTNDEIANVLLGIKELYELKFQKCFDMFEALIKDKKIT